MRYFLGDLWPRKYLGVKENILALKENLSNFYLTAILNVQILFNQETILFSSNYSFKIIKLILKSIISWVIHGPNTWHNFDLKLDFHSNCFFLWSKRFYQWSGFIYLNVFESFVLTVSFQGRANDSKQGKGLFLRIYQQVLLQKMLGQFWILLKVIKMIWLI